MFQSSVLDGATSLISQPPVEGVKVVPIEGKGRGVVTTRFFQPGEVVVLEAPYAAVPILEEIDTICSARFTRLSDDSGNSCSGCKSVRYSSKEAQKADWAAGHKLECKNWQQLRAMGSTPGHVPESLIRLLCRILWKRERQLRAGEEVPFWQSFDAVAALVDHTAEQSGVEMKKQAMHRYIADKALDVAKFSQLPLSHIDKADASKLSSKMKSNSMHITLDQGDSVGLGVYPFCSMLNHSDRPNAYQSFRGGKLQIRAIEPIEKGQEICITYSELDKPSFDRRRHLVSNFCFDNRPDLPRTEKMPELHSQDLSPPIRACVLDSDVSKLLQLNDTDAALCALNPKFMKVTHGLNFCWVYVLSPHIEADWAKNSETEAQEYLKRTGDTTTLEPPSEEDRGELQSCAVASQVRSVLEQGWSRGDAHAGPQVSENGAKRISRWQQQVEDEGWKMVVRMFGDWSTEAPDYTSRRWLEVASAAAFGAAGLMWAEQMRTTGELELSREMLLAVEAAGDEVGLAESHQVMLQVQVTVQGGVQARTELAKLYVKESNSLGGYDLQGAKQQTVMISAMKYCHLIIDAKERIFPQAWYELGWTYRTLGDCHAIVDKMDSAVEWWAKAYECMHTLLGPTPEVQSIKGRLLVQTAGDDKEKLREAVELLQAAL